MDRIQFKVLFREFLFRMVDLEVLAAQGDVNKLLGQFAALLTFVSSVLGLRALFIDPRRVPPNVLLGISWHTEHMLIATTMLVVGLFAVLSWDSTLPNRRDVLVLAPLPLRSRTLFLAKAAALATALGLTVAALNVCTGLTWPPLLAAAGSSGFLQSYFAYWITALAAGAFIFCGVLAVQGIAAQLPRRQFLTVSSFLQMAAFGLFVSVYFLQPSLARPAAIVAAKNQHALAWLPSYWFFGLFHTLNGSTHPVMAPLAKRAMAGLAVALAGAAIAFLLSYFRTMRKIVEEPDIIPGSHGIHWLPPFGGPAVTAIVQFAIRTLVRSRQHRVILAFYLGVAFAVVTISSRVDSNQQNFEGEGIVGLLASSILTLCFWMAGTRVVFTMPMDLRANWIFRITAVRQVAEYIVASRRALLALSVAPVTILSGLVLFTVWPWQRAAGHVAALVLLGLILTDVGLRRFRKIPFTCSYLPGKSHAHMVFLSGFGVLLLAVWAAELERTALATAKGYATLMAVMGVAWAIARWFCSSDEDVVEFEDVPAAVILPLGLTRDGVPPRYEAR
jgi:hypothetical protein